MQTIYPNDLPRLSSGVFVRDGDGLSFTFEPVEAMDGNTYIRASSQLVKSSDWDVCTDAAKAAGWNIEPVAEVRIVGDLLCKVSRVGNHPEYPDS